ncbi:hypothetical protein, partial [Bradyrhizobium sp.]
MDLRLAQKHLKEAEQHVLLGRQHVARQLEIIRKLERGGHSTVLAADLLATFRLVLANHIAHRDLIRSELA